MKRVDGMLGSPAVRAILALGLLVWPLHSCGDSMAPPPPTTPPPLGAVVTDPLPPPLPAAPRSARAAASTLAPEVTYVSLVPGTAPDGRIAHIRDTRTGDTLSVPVGAGGFDPVPMPAAAGDTLEIIVEVSTGGQPLEFRAIVPLRRSPSVVRTYPPSGKRDVPLNTSVVIVFSEPIDPATVTPSTVQVQSGSTPVPGTLTLADPEHVVFVPAAPLAPSTLYTVTVTVGVHDPDGDGLETAFIAEFTTAATPTGYEEYFVDSYLQTSVHQVGDTVSVDQTVRVMDGAGTGIERALLRFRASVGTVEPDTTRAGLDGLATVHWKFAGIVGVLPPQATAELDACASNSSTRCDMYWPEVVIGFDPL